MVDIEMTEVAFELQHEAEAYRDLGGRERQHEHVHDLAVCRGPVRAGSNERKPGRVHHDFERHELKEHVPPHHHAGEPEREQHTREHHHVLDRNRDCGASHWISSRRARMYRRPK
jgi:hypothetical protein